MSDREQNLQKELMRLMQSTPDGQKHLNKHHDKNQVGHNKDTPKIDPTHKPKNFEKNQFPKSSNDHSNKKDDNKKGSTVTEKEGEEVDQQQLDINRVKIVTLNQKISQHASRKELQQAYELYQEALRDGLANLHTYAAMVNVAVRCANMSIAEEVVKTMKSQGRKLKDVVLYTTLMKGYCAQGMLTQAVNLYLEMLNKLAVVQPNVRTVNTLLRGCVQMGEIHVAETVFQHAHKELKIPLDVSSWEYLVTLLAQGLQLDKLLPIIGRLKSDESMQSGLASMNINLARAAVLLGDWKTCRKALAAASAAMDTEGSERQEGDQGNGKMDTTDSSVTNAKKAVKGGKRAWKSQGEDPLSVDERRNQSLLLYREHIREEWKQEVQLLTDFVTHLEQEQVKSSKSSKIAAYEYLFPFFYHCLSFDASTEANSADKIRRQVFRSVCYKFGLDAFLKKTGDYDCVELLGEPVGSLDTNEKAVAVEDEDSDEGEDAAAVAETTDNNKKQKKAYKKKTTKSASLSLKEALLSVPGAQVKSTKVDASKAESFKAALQDLKTQIYSYFSNDGFINFAHVFAKHSVYSKQSADLNASKPVKMEICSGAGEWAVTQAKSDPASPWVTLELRHDRVHQTATKMMYANVHNLCVMGGDAMQVLPRHIAADSVGHIFVNHPEPPQQTGGETSEGFHLLNEEFFKEVDRMLVLDGMLTVVTDNLWYGKFLVRLLNGLSSRLKSVTSKDSSMIGSKWNVHFENEDVVLWEGEPGKEAGHVVEASSYFDRLWKRGQLQERYFIVLRKTNKLNKVKTQKIPLKISITAPAANKKITKFDDDDNSSSVAEVPVPEVARTSTSFVQKDKGAKVEKQENNKKRPFHEGNQHKPNNEKFNFNKKMKK